MIDSPQRVERPATKDRTTAWEEHRDPRILVWILVASEEMGWMTCEMTCVEKNATWPMRKGRTRSAGHASSSTCGGCCISAEGWWSREDGEGYRVLVLGGPFNSES